MASTIGDLVAAFKVEFADGVANLRTIVQHVRDTEKKVVASFDEMAGGSEAAGGKMKRGFAGVLDTLKSLGPVVTKAAGVAGIAIGAVTAAVGVLGAKLAQVAMGVAGASSKFESWRVQLETLLGSTEKAQKALDWLTEFSDKTPFALGQVIDAFTRLTAQGVDAGKVLESLGNAAAGMQKPLMQVAEAFIDASVGEFERLKELGVRAGTVGKQIVFEYQTSSGEVKRIATENSRATIQATLEAIWSERYGGAMDRFQSSWQGMVSNLKTIWELFVKSIGDAGSFDAMKEAVAGLTIEIRTLKETGTLDQWAQIASDGLSMVARAFTELVRLPLYFQIALNAARADFFKFTADLDEATLGTLQKLRLFATAIEGLPGFSGAKAIAALDSAILGLQASVTSQRAAFEQYNAEAEKHALELLLIEARTRELVKARVADSAAAATQAEREAALAAAHRKAAEEIDAEIKKLQGLYGVLTTQQIEEQAEALVRHARLLLTAGVSAEQVYEKLIPKAQQLADEFGRVEGVDLPREFTDMVDAAKLGPALFANWATTIGRQIPAATDAAEKAVEGLATGTAEAVAGSAGALQTSLEGATAAAGGAGAAVDQALGGAGDAAMTVSQVLGAIAARLRDEI
ncbi:MAG TPA: tape measure protein, partial [Thermoanaerobaculales bacterium]|nr:tape measure protein [Thermoanaerobaculales bacterium]